MRRAPPHPAGTLGSDMVHDDQAMTVYLRLLSDRAEEALRDLDALHEVSRRAARLTLPVDPGPHTIARQPSAFLLK